MSYFELDRHDFLPTNDEAAIWKKSEICNNLSVWLFSRTALVVRMTGLVILVTIFEICKRKKATFFSYYGPQVKLSQISGN